MKRITILLLFFLICVINLKSKAQLNYGNEWIDKDKKYIKISVSEESMYTLSYQDILNAAITDNQIINPQHFQLYNKGIEVPLIIAGSEDNTFDPQDKIYFYGKGNNADLDKAMYSEEAHIPNNNVSLFEDGNHYFLTYNTNKVGLRYTTPTNTTGSTSLNYVLTKSRLDFKSSYYPGEYILETMSLSEYINGEGYMSNLIGKGQSVTYNLNTSGYINTPEVTPSLSFYVAGRSNSSIAGSQNHHFRLKNGNAIICDTLFSGYRTIRNTKPITITGEMTTIDFQVVDDLSPGTNFTDYQAISYLELMYPRHLTLNNSALRFTIPSQHNSVALNFTFSSLSPILIDIKNNFVYNASNSAGSTLTFNNILNVNSEFYLFDLQQSKPATYTKTTFRNLSPSDIKQTIIISNKAFSSGAEAYLNYNQQERNLPTSLIYTEEIYNEFFYGFHHPRAINNFIKWSLDKSDGLLKSVLLLGRGISTPRGNLSSDYVPTYGYPASDNMLGIFNNAKASSVAIGRIPAKNNDDIHLYLNKLRIYESLPNEMWRKKIVNVTGGGNESEFRSFRTYLRNLSNVASNGSLGAYTVNFDKTVSDAVTENLTAGIISQTNSGTSLITFLGHGSASLTAVSLGTATSLNNNTKPTNYLINGCSTGNAFSNSSSYAENMILAENGAISWIGTTSEGVASYLFNFSNGFYNHWFQKNYDKPIAEGFRLGVNDQTNFNDRLNLAHSRQYIFFGDPNLKFYNPELPDYNIANEKIFANNRNQNAAQENFLFNFIVDNIGKKEIDSLEIKISRRIEEKNIETTHFLTVKPVANTDTFSYSLPNISSIVSGNNIITIELDPNRKLSEINKLNNKASQTFFLPGNGVHAIYPLRNSIAFGEVTLMAQPDNLLTKNESFIFEIDTTNSFNSPIKATSPIISADLFPTWKPHIQFQENQVYFWRVAIDAENRQWASSAFTYSNKQVYGQNISHFEQIHSSEYIASNIIVNEQSNNFGFQKDLFSTTISTRGDGVPVAQQERRIRTNPLNAISYIPTEIDPGMTMVSYDKTVKNKIISYPSPYNSVNGPFPINGYTGQYYWNTTDPIALDSMVSYINQLPEGAHVLGVNNYNCDFKNMPEHVKQAFRSIGLKEFEKVGLGEPYMFWGRKGAAVGEAIEHTADYNSDIPAREQYFSFSYDIEYSVPNGHFITDKFGPAKKWVSAEFSHELKPGDIQKIDIYAIDKNNNESLILSNDVSEKIDLSFISAEETPHLKFKVYLESDTYRTLPKLNYWKVLYEPLPEVTINPTIINEFHSEKIALGDSIKLQLGISNISPFNSDSLQLDIKFTSEDNTSNYKSIHLKPIPSFKNDTIQFSYPSVSLKGETVMHLTVNNKKHNDNYSFNNTISYTTIIEQDNSAPNIDVLVDGKRIINGEIVSPTPIFTITSIDNNKFLNQIDTSLVEVYMKLPTSDTYKRYYYSQGVLQVQQKVNGESNGLLLQFIPEKLVDGYYSLKIVSKDHLGNKHANDYVLDFEVINASSITNFYPYPNPVIDKMKFVFTITGERTPEKLKIQILNVSGKVVREIFKEELGNLKIGHNISDFTWDGTDMYGNKLAKGVYFYKIHIEDSSSQFKHRFSKGDAFFKNNIGKIYLIK